jgi:aminoglycoside phosphotransferase (APT) family kinase protein
MAGGISGMAEVQRKLATMHGIPVLTTVKLGGANPQQQAQIEQARAQVEAMKKQGGPQAALADKMLAQMGGGSAVITHESSGFSSSPVSVSVFAVPKDYQKADK